MLTQENEYYIRLILLLLRGGTQVLKQVFLKKLEDRGSHLNAFLQINKEAIKKLKEGKVLTLKQYNILFPVNGNVTEICEWDISLFACVLLNFFAQSFQKSEEKAIENIRTFRNDFAGHHPDGCIDARTFFRKWNQLSNFVINLGNELSSSERSDLTELIKRVGDDPIEIKRAIQDLKDATGTTDQFMEHVSQLLEHLSHTVQQLNSRLDEMSKVLQDTQTDIKGLKNSSRSVSTVIVGEVTLSSENPKAVIAAAKTLIDKTKRSIGLSTRPSTALDGGRQGLKSTVSTFFARVKGHVWKTNTATTSETANEQSSSQKGVTALVQDIHKAGGEVVDVTPGSVLLHIQCHSVNELLDVLKYFNSSDIDQRLDFIAECLTEELGCRINLSACIQVESLQEAFHLIQEKQNPVFEKRVLLSIKCEKSEGVLNVVKLFEDGDASNKLFTISKDLSNELGSPVVLRASFDTETLHEYVHATKGNQLEQGETPQGVMRLEPLVEMEAHGSLSEKPIEKEIVNSDKEDYGFTDQSRGVDRRRPVSWKEKKEHKRSRVEETFTDHQSECFLCLNKDGQIKQLQDKISELQGSLEKNKKDYEYDLNQVIRSKEGLEKQYHAEKQHMQRKYQEGLHAKEEALRRSVASSKLRDKNPNITDLSDQNRPTKIAEKMSELYDNQWTDAFDVLESEMDDRHIIQTLLDALMRVSDECRRLSDENFFERVQQSIESPIEAREIPKSRILLSDQLKQQIKEFRKNRAAAVIKDIEKIIKTKIKLANHPAKEVQDYLSRCVEIGWLCAVQDPPLFLKAQSPLQFDTNAFKDYTTRGRYVEFVVWPALYLHEGGVLLAKGVAQGTDHKPTPKGVAQGMPARIRAASMQAVTCANRTYAKTVDVRRGNEFRVDSYSTDV